jgi:hypothetical protein
VIGSVKFSAEKPLKLTYEHLLFQKIFRLAYARHKEESRRGERMGGEDRGRAGGGRGGDGMGGGCPGLQKRKSGNPTYDRYEIAKNQMLKFEAVLLGALLYFVAIRYR